MFGNPLGYPLGGVINYGGNLFTQTVTATTTSSVVVTSQNNFSKLIAISTASAVSFAKLISRTLAISTASVVSFANIFSPFIAPPSQIKVLNPAVSTERDKNHAINSLIKQVRSLISSVVTAASVTNTPAGGIASTNVQDALNELDTDKLAVSVYTAADVFAKVLTEDGSGSGLDADTLDSHDSTYFSPLTRVLIAATTRSLALTDAGNVLWNNTGGAVTLTIPTNATVAIPVNTQIDLLAWNTTITIAAASGVSLGSPNGLLTVGPQFGGATLLKVATDNWALFGALQ